MRVQSGLDAGLVLCLGLFPALHLPALQLAALLVLIGAVLNARRAFGGGRAPGRIGWHHVAIFQFLILSVLNVLAFPVMEGNRAHYKPLALESLATTLLVAGVMVIYLRGRAPLWTVWTRWLPVGLIVSFAIVSWFFLSGGQGARVQGFAPNALLPPLWFLVLTLVSFCNFGTMTPRHKALRIALMGLAALMAIYSGGRLVMIAWLLSALALTVMLRPAAQTGRGGRSMLLGLGGIALLSGAVFVIDRASGGTMAFRMQYTVQGLLSGEARQSFLRLELWSAAWELITERPLLGYGQINERIAIHQIIEREWWFRAHQTYLSFWIGGGVIGLASGLAFMAAGARFIRRRADTDLRPAALGLIGVIGLNGLTESVFQSFAAVQLVTLLVLLLAGSAAPAADATRAAKTGR